MDASANKTAQVDYPVQIVPLEGEAPLTQVERLWAEDLCRFFTRNMLRDKVMPYTEGKRTLSERDMTWAAVHFFKQFPVEVRDPDTGMTVSLHTRHSEYTEEFGRNLFDPFKRVYKDRTRHLRVVCRDDPTFEMKCTAIAQLNWYRFALKYCFLEACEQHIDEIKAHWAETQRKRKQVRMATLAITGKKAKRSPLFNSQDSPAFGSCMVRGTVNIGF